MRGMTGHAAGVDDGTVDSFLREVASAPALVPPLFTTGAVLGETYELRERLGAGGMAVVYRAHDQRLGRDVAVKVPRIDGLTGADRDQRIRMFEREAQATARLTHPGIVTLHHVGDHHGVPFLVLELLTGETLAARLARRQVLPIAEATAILDGLLAALAFAHDRGFVHRDLTPKNVFLTTDDRVKVLDFGVAIEAATASGTVTRAAGTPGYMAPEHSDGADARGDLWAAAVLFVESVTGHRPDAAAPRGDTLPETVPRPLRSIVARALADDPARRPTTAAEMRLALTPEVVATRSPRGRDRARRLIAGAAVTALALIVVAVWWSRRDDGPRTAAIITPRDGVWRGDPAGETPWETRLERSGPTTFRYENHNRVDGRTGRGELTLERLRDGTTTLSGRTADVPTCPTCTNVGYIEFIVLAPDKLYQNKSAWGPSHDHYVEWFPPYRYAWQGPLAAVR
jgi:tRNA A-37 threonylcarbamoyl transferase component Bud32